MALLKCPECGKDVSSEAITCPHCGYPIKKYKNEKLVNIVVPKTKEGFPFESDWYKNWAKRARVERLLMLVLLAVICAVLIPIMAKLGANPITLYFCIILLVVIGAFLIGFMFIIKNHVTMVEEKPVVLFLGFTGLFLIVDGEVKTKKLVHFVSSYLRTELPSGRSLKVRVNDFKGVSFFIDE